MKTLEILWQQMGHAWFLLLFAVLVFTLIGFSLWRIAANARDARIGVIHARLKELNEIRRTGVLTHDEINEMRELYEELEALAK